MNLRAGCAIVLLILGSLSKVKRCIGSGCGRLLGAVAFPLCVTPVPGQTSSFGDATAVETLQQEILNVLSRTDTPGGAVVLVDREGLVWSAGLGAADLGEQRSVTETTRFRLGSISKMFVSLAVLKLVEEGRLNLHQRVAELAPEIQFENRWEETQPVRLVHLLEHTAGFDDLHLREFAWNEADPLELKEALQFNPSSRISRWPPGHYFSYSNSGSAMAAYIVEKVTGRSYESWVAASLFLPLEMSSATFDSSPALATGHSGGEPVPYWNLLYRPAGALNATAADMGHLIRMFLNRGRFLEHEIVSEESIQRMETPTSTRAAGDGIRVGAGPGTVATSDQGLLWYGHGGETNGTLANLQYVPAIGRGYLVVLNSNSVEAMQSVTRLIRAHLLSGIALPESAPSQIPAWRVSGLAGYYRPLTVRHELHRPILNFLGVIRLQMDGNRLRVAGTDPAQVLIPVTDRRFRGPEDLLPTASVHEEEGRIVLQSFSRDFRGNYQAVAWWRVWVERGLAALVLALLASTPMHALLWIPRRIVGRTGPGTHHLELGLFPLLGFLALACGLTCAYLAMRDPIPRLGLLTVYSGGLFVAGIAFAVFSCLAGLQVVRSFRWEADVRLRVYCSLVTLASLAATAYFWSYGWLGLRLWAS